MIKPTEYLKHKIELYDKIIDLAIDRYIVYFENRDLCQIKQFLIKKYYATILLNQLVVKHESC